MRWLAFLLAFVVSGCLTTKSYTDQDVEHARQIAAAFAQGYLEMPDLGFPRIQVLTSLQSDDIPLGERDSILAMYRAENQTMYLLSGWKPDLWGTSVLVHEYVHYLQTYKYNGFCREQWEKQAFEVQFAFLKAYGGIDSSPEDLGLVIPKGCR